MRKLVAGLVLLALLAGGWTVLWVYAAHEAGAQLDAWLKSEDAQGRTWTCPDRAIGGYPAAITIDCTKPTFIGHAPDQTAYGQAAHMTAEVALTHPKSLKATLQPPLTYRTSDGQADIKAGWSSFGLELGGLPSVQTTTLHARDLVVEGTLGEGGDRQRTAAPVLDASFAAAAPGQDPSLDFTIALKGSAVPVVDDLLGTQAAVDVDLAGRLDHADAGNARSLEEALENWRQAGGRLDLAQSKISHGDASVSGSGALRLDDAHRPQGRIDASFVGLEPVLKRYGISGNMAAAGSLLNSLFGGGRQKAPAEETPGALNLPISLQNGRVGIGPIRTQIAVPPLY